ncbi:MAG: winged helix-turn-helix domain-containing protein [Solirubrobacterales bacterium]
MTQSISIPPGSRVPRGEQDLETRMAKALAHPLRARILARLNERVASPNELSRELGEPLGNVSYHVKALLELRCVELVDTAQRRGAIEHYYRAVTRAGLDHGAFKKLPASVRSEISGMTVEEAIGDVAQAFKAGTFDGRTDRHASFTRLSLDEQAFGELTEAVGRLLDRALALQTESAGRRRNGSDGGGEVLTGLALLAYETPAG